MERPELRRTVRAGRYHELHVRDCPLEPLLTLVREIGVDATVENLRPRAAPLEWFTSVQRLFPGAPPAAFQLREVCLDVALSNEQFLQHAEHWDQRGVYAVFCERSPIAFRATSLEDLARYRALENFGFVMELALGSFDGSRVASPRREVVDRAEVLIAAAMGAAR